MKWNFILETDIGYGPVQTVIPEPVGYSEAVFKFKRDLDLHGIFFEYSASLKFHGLGYDMIAAEYAANGVEGYMRLIIQFSCSDTDPFEDFYTAKINFSKIEFENSAVCLVNVPIEDDNCLSMLKNRQDQKVDLELNTSLDGEALTDYGLPLNILLPPKTFILHSQFEEEVETSLSWDQLSQDGLNSGLEIGPGLTLDNAYSTRYVQIGFNDIILDETGDSDNTFVAYETVDEVTPILVAGRTGVYDIDLRVSILVEMGGDGGANIRDTNSAPPIGLDSRSVQIFIQFNDGIPFQLSTSGASAEYPQRTSCTPPDSTSYSVTGVAYTASLFLNIGDRIKLYTRVGFGVAHAHNLNGASSEFLQLCAKVTLYDNDPFHENYFHATLVTNNGTTACDVVMVNEALSRTVESPTNDCLRVKSDYFGRVDSLPYTSAEDGLGSLECVTNGLKIRQRLTTMPFSFNDIYNGLNAIHFIGMGMEPDTVRGGNYYWIRIEPVKYFYDTAVVLICDKVPEITRRVIAEEHYSIFNFGYAKWEAEQYNGLDEFATKRSYRTSLQNIKNTLDKVCNLIASGYAIEITKGEGRTSKDWRYDNDQFIICLKRVGLCCWDLTGFPPIWGGDGSTCGEAMFFDSDLNIAVSGGPGAYLTTITEIVDTLLSAYGITVTVDPDNPNIICLEPADYPTYHFTNAYILGSFTPYPACTFDQILFTGPYFCHSEVEQGNISGSGTTLIDPATVINFRISPNRNLLRWLPKVLASYNDPSIGQMIFMSGEGNILAEGLLTTYPIEAAVLSEEEPTVMESTLAVPADAEPIYELEQWEFRYPMSVQDYHAVKANPRGIVQVRYGQQTHFTDCYIRSIEYKPVKGEAQFTLIPKLSSGEFADHLLMETGDELLQETGDFILLN